MCGRYALKAKISELVSTYPLQNAVDFDPIDNVAPSMDMPIIIHDRIGFAQWGLIPSWANPQDIKGKLFNARSETIHEKPSFKDSWNRKRRCIIPATAFYEWDARTKRQRGREPHVISLTNAPIFGFAGIWSKKKNNVSYTIITRDAVHPIKDIHPRMPVMLTPDQFNQWFRASHDDAHTLLKSPKTDSFIACSKGNSDLNAVASA